MMKLQDETTGGQHITTDLERIYEQVEDDGVTSSRCGLQVGVTPTQELESRSTQQMYEGVREVLTTQRHGPQVGATTTHDRTVQYNIYEQTDFEMSHGKEKKQVSTHQVIETDTSQL